MVNKMTTTESIIKSEFLIEEDIYYLNHAAVAPWPKRTTDAVKKFAEENVNRGAQNYKKWVEKETELREQLREFINAESIDEISLLKNTSEALSVVACGIDWQAGDNVVSTNQEFPSNRIVWQAQQKHGVEFREINIDQTDDPEQSLMVACDEKTRIISLSSVQYGTGFKLDLIKIGQFCRNEGILYCVDAIQSIGAHHFDVQQIQADFVMADGHKWMLGPEGLALFYCRKDLLDRLELNQYGWHMVEDYTNYDAKTWAIAANARRFECGSPNMLGIHALSASISLLADIGITIIERNILNNTKYLIDNIKNNDQLILITPEQESRYAGIVTFKIQDGDHPKIHRKLLENNVICAYRAGGIRFSPHFYTPRSVINKSLEILNIII